MNRRTKNEFMIGAGAVMALIGATILGCGIKKNRDLSQLREYALIRIGFAAQSARSAMGGSLGKYGRIAIMKLRRTVKNAQDELEIENAIGVADRIKQLSLDNPQDMKAYIERVAKVHK